MTDNTSNKNEPKALEDKQGDKKLSLFSKVRFTAILAVFVLVCWAIIEYVTPNQMPFKESIIGTVGTTNEASQTDTSPATLTENAPRSGSLMSMIEENNSAQNLVDTAEERDAPQEELAKELADIKQVVPNDPPPPPAPLHQKQRHIPHHVMVKHQEEQQQKDHLIGLLDCQVKLNQTKYNTATLHQTLQACYAILMSADVALSDYKTLTDIQSGQGIPSKTALVELFKTAAVSSLRISHKEEGIEKNVLDDVTEYLSSLITIRKKGWQEGDSVEAIIGRAEHHLENAAYDKLSTELETLPPSAEIVFAQFNEALAQHLAFENAMNTLQTTAHKARQK